MRGSTRRRALLVVTIMLVAGLTGGVAPLAAERGGAAQQLAQTGANAQLAQTGANAQFKTLYHAGSDTYFELARGPEGEPVSWAEARGMARQKVHKGRRGRLAIVDSPDIHRWLMRHFNLNALGYGGRTWIGLQYWCSYRALTWVSGEEHKFSAFSVWDSPWYRDDGIRCGLTPNLAYMGVYYEAATQRWRAVAARKRFPYFLVEYPPTE